MNAKEHILVMLMITVMPGCIPVKSTDQLWQVAGVDKSLSGTWYTDELADNFIIHFEDCSTNMLCSITYRALSNSAYSAEPMHLPPVLCRVSKDDRSNVSFLLFPHDSCKAITGHFSSLPNPDAIIMGALIPYKVTEDKRLIVYSGNEIELVKRITGNQMPGGLINEGGSPPSRKHSRPYLTNPNLDALRTIAADLLITNAPILTLKADLGETGTDLSLEIKDDDLPASTNKASGDGPAVDAEHPAPKP